jgi:hypothetical protein
MRFLSIEYAIPSKQVTNEEIVRKILKKSSPHFFDCTGGFFL